MSRPLTAAALATALLASCANDPVPPMHEAHGLALRVPLPVFALDAEGEVTSFPLGSFRYDLDLEQTGASLEYEMPIDEQGQWTWVSGLGFADYSIESMGADVDGDAVLLSTGARRYFRIESQLQPFASGSLSYSPKLDIDGNDYGAFAYMSLGGGVAWFPTLDFGVHVGLDWVETLVEPDYNELQFTGTQLFSVEDKINFRGLSLWVSGSWWF